MSKDQNEDGRIRQVIERDMPPLSYELVEGNLKHLQGQVLTVVEAVVTDQTSLKATKDLVKNFFNEKLTHLFSMYGDPEKEMPEYSPVAEDGFLVSVKE